jgi:hypothetical protein
MLDDLINYLPDNIAFLITGAVLALLLITLLAVVITRTYRRFSRLENRAEKLTSPAMFAGMLWSAEAVWVIAEKAGLPPGLRLAMCAVMEFFLLVAMLRTSDSMKANNHPGRSGLLAWVIAVLMAVAGVIAGLIQGNIGVALFRPMVPLVLTAIWWIGVIGEGDPGEEKEQSSWNWTPRNLLIRVGALKPGKQDVKKVQREHLTQRMTDLYYQVAYADPATDSAKEKKIRARLAKLTLDADDSIVREVMTRVRRTGWVQAQVLPYDLTQVAAPATAHGDAPGDATPDASVTQSGDAVTRRVALPPVRRGRAVTQTLTSGDAGDADPSTQAARLSVTQNIPLREAVRQVPGATEATARRRRDAMAADAPVTQKPINGHPVFAGAGATSEEN